MKNGWIDVNDRLPEEGIEVIILLKAGPDDDEPISWMGLYTKEFGWEIPTNSGWKRVAPPGQIIAWQPLPKPEVL